MTDTTNNRSSPLSYMDPDVDANWALGATPAMSMRVENLGAGASHSPTDVLLESATYTIEVLKNYCRPLSISSDFKLTGWSMYLVWYQRQEVLSLRPDQRTINNK